jgi:hypothetical protein
VVMDGRLYREGSEAVTAFRTSVMEVFAEPWPDFRRLWCMDFCDWPWAVWTWCWLARFGTCRSCKNAPQLDISRVTSMLVDVRKSRRTRSAMEWRGSCCRPCLSREQAGIVVIFMTAVERSALNRSVVMLHANN